MRKRSERFEAIRAICEDECANIPMVCGNCRHWDRREFKVTPKGQLCECAACKRTGERLWSNQLCQRLGKWFRPSLAALRRCKCADGYVLESMKVSVKLYLNEPRPGDEDIGRKVEELGMEENMCCGNCANWDKARGVYMPRIDFREGKFMPGAEVFRAPCLVNACAYNHDMDQGLAFMTASETCYDKNIGWVIECHWRPTREYEDAMRKLWELYESELEEIRKDHRGPWTLPSISAPFSWFGK